MKRHYNKVIWRREEKIRKKKEKQTKIMTVLGIIVGALALIGIAWWAFYSVDAALTKPMSEAQKLEMFRTDDGLPDEDDIIVGTWYCFSADGKNIDSKYVFDADGTLSVYKTSKQSKDGYALYSQAKYRLRPYAGQMYVLPGDQYKIVTYEYDIEEKDGSYILSWTYGDTTWKMLRVSE